MEYIDFLDGLDQARYILGLLAAFLVFFYHAAPKREHFTIRIIAGFLTCILASSGYLGMLWFYLSTGMFEAYAVIAVIYWLAMTFLVIGYMVFCYQISWGHALFRGFMACALEGFVTTILKYIIVTMLLPDLPEKHTLSYVFLSVAVYAVIYGLAYRFIARQIQGTKSAEVLSSKKTVVIYVCLIIIYSLICDASRGITEWILQPIGAYEEMEYIIRVVQYYSIGVVLLSCAIILLLQYYVYEVAVLQREKTWFHNLLLERQMQYEHSKENIDIINQKCHELKKRIIEMEQATEPERQEMLQETKKAVMFYDAVVKTNNEVLNTILTEKSLICANHGINLTCMVNAEHLSQMDSIDLYTILENALDNAIDCAKDLQEEGKKAVAISIYERGRMLYMSVENYYEETITMRDGLPINGSKGKKGNGMGLQSIRMLARKYGGDIGVLTENQIFILQIALPISGLKR